MNTIKQTNDPLLEVAISYVYEVKDHISQQSMQKIITIFQNFIQNLITYDDAATSLAQHIDSISPLEKINSILQCDVLPPPDSPPVQIDDTSSRKKTRTWTSNEDQRLILGVHKHGLENWNAVSQFVGFGRSRSQCSQRWLRVLDPRISKNPWSPEEETKLQQLVNRYGEKSWTRIASEMGNRSDVQCRYHFRQLQGVPTMSPNNIQPIEHNQQYYSNLPRTNSTPVHTMNQPMQISYQNRIPLNSMINVNQFPHQNLQPTNLINNNLLNLQQNNLIQQQQQLNNNIEIISDDKKNIQNEQIDNTKQINLENTIPLKGSFDIFKSDQLFSSDWM